MASDYHNRAQAFIKSSKDKGYQVKAEGSELIAYPKGKPKSFEQNVKEDIVKAGKAVKQGVKKAAKIPGKVMDTIEGGFKRVDAATKERDMKLINQNFGSEENYNKMMAKNKK